MAEPLVRLDRVSLSLGGQQVLTEVSLAVEPGRIVTIVGPNGAGKSTLVKVALGLLPPEAGHVHRRPGLAIGYVPQRLVVAPTLPLSVRRFLAMAVPRARLADMEQSLERVGAGHVLARQVTALSGGELQRVMLARAVLRRPDFLALDEPVGGVDMTGQAELYDLIAGLARDHGSGVLMVSHDLHVVMAATDEVVCLNRHVCCAGHPEAVSRHPEYLGLFGPRAAGSLAIYTHVHDHAHLADGTVGADSPHVNGPHGHGPDCRHG
ncbi:zinc ABC transporter ATP-binding protein ZnuC [Magnetospirillum sp. UT-4]|uniref:zinc ABC transporter ATP-binding protein ZnuC n=1 Tax=Magnetospirillum sp. UT-4 TaxID=2681467 RepID=UPI0013865DC0|nr:zinc ABC transporter ATP-binding protein ZnuC [Magnetospirillum sp. UT-4]CAA7620263.1 zinc transporter subunit: ATP-binding component of ABC superfamily [Magnetospirillum sp. UT-4]